jgi:hypothetical protein
MTPAAIIAAATSDGVSLTLSPTGSIKVSGESEAVSRWTPTIAASKAGIVEALKAGDQTPPPICEAFEERAGIIEFDGGLARPDAEQAAFEQTCKNCEHMTSPGRSAGYCGAEAMRDTLQPAYGDGHPLRRLPDDAGASCAAFEQVEGYQAPNPTNSEADERRTCRQCRNLSRLRGNVCTVASPGGIVSAVVGYRPALDMKLRCPGYAPLADDPDQRPGGERWPNWSLT